MGGITIVIVLLVLLSEQSIEDKKQDLLIASLSIENECQRKMPAFTLSERRDFYNCLTEMTKINAEYMRVSGYSDKEIQEYINQLPDEDEFLSLSYSHVYCEPTPQQLAIYDGVFNKYQYSTNPIEKSALFHQMLELQDQWCR